jgi:hypothetical protein
MTAAYVTLAGPKGQFQISSGSLVQELFCIVNTSHLVAKNNLDK